MIHDRKVPDELVRAIRDGKKFAVTGHVQPDGDALGAVLAVTHLLRLLDKEAVPCVVMEQVPEKYCFLPGVELLGRPGSGDFDVLIALDVGNHGRLGDSKPLLESAKTVLNVDHHPDNTAFGGVNWVVPDATSTCELVYDIWTALGVEMTADAALCIYVGILTDTGNWQYSNTTANALRIGARLLDYGIKPNDVFTRLYEQNTYGWLRLMGLGLSRTVIVPEYRFAYCVVMQADLALAGAEPYEAENLVDRLRSLRDIDVALVIKETKSGQYKGSVRSQGKIDVGGMSAAFDGGGHRNAAGFTTDLSPARIVERMKKWMAENAKTK